MAVYFVHMSGFLVILVATFVAFISICTKSGCPMKGEILVSPNGDLIGVDQSRIPGHVVVRSTVKKILPFNVFVKIKEINYGELNGTITRLEDHFPLWVITKLDPYEEKRTPFRGMGAKLFAHFKGKYVEVMLDKVESCSYAIILLSAFGLYILPMLVGIGQILWHLFLIALGNIRWEGIVGILAFFGAFIVTQVRHAIN